MKSVLIILWSWAGLMLLCGCNSTPDISKEEGNVQDTIIISYPKGVKAIGPASIAEDNKSIIACCTYEKWSIFRPYKWALIKVSSHGAIIWSRNLPDGVHKLSCFQNTILVATYHGVKGMKIQKFTADKGIKIGEWKSNIKGIDYEVIADDSTIFTIKYISMCKYGLTKICILQNDVQVIPVGIVTSSKANEVDTCMSVLMPFIVPFQNGYAILSSEGTDLIAPYDKFVLNKIEGEHLLKKSFASAPESLKGVGEVSCLLRQNTLFVGDSYHDSIKQRMSFDIWAYNFSVDGLQKQQNVPIVNWYWRYYMEDVRDNFILLHGIKRKLVILRMK